MDSASLVPPPAGERPAGPDERLTTLRIIDANHNRAAEGLRMVEDYCRFGLNDQHLTERCKCLRHDLTTALALLDPRELAAARQTEADVGTSITTPQEQSRDSLVQIAAASWQRVQQALRVIEECLKLIAPAASAQVEALRYQSYTLAKACTITVDSQARLANARLYVLIDGASSECAFIERAADLIAAGVHVLQLRDKQLDDRTLLARARLLRRIIDEGSKLQPLVGWTSGPSEVVEQSFGPNAKNKEPDGPEVHPTNSPLFILNDRPDLAVLARADGVHVGQEELTVHDVRQIVGAEMLVGVSTHSIEQARQAVLDGANYLGCGPTFPSGTKHFDRFPGTEFLRQVAAEISLPAFAIGGITLENVPQVLATGFSRIAVGGALARHADVSRGVASLLTALRAPEQQQ